MEPANVKPNSPEDAQLEAWLRANSAASPLPDDGFSARVLTALPPAAPARAEQSRSSRRGWLCAAAALLGVFLVAKTSPSSSNAVEQLQALLPPLQAAAALLTDARTLLALVVTAVSLAFVYRRELRIRLLP